MYCPHGYDECDRGCVYPGRCGRFTAKEGAEHKRLLQLWATRRATMRQIHRCMELDRKAAA